MITTVTLNPAVDKTILIENFQLGRVNRIEEGRQDPGGKGINVSKVVASLGHKTLATGLIGGRNGQWINEALLKRGIETDFVWVEQETRTNIKIVDLVSNQYTDINDRGYEVEHNSLEHLFEKITYWARLSKVMVLSGSLPEGVSEDIYQKLIEISEKNGCKTILDTAGSALINGIKAGPHMIKPNIHELESSLKVQIKNQKDILQCAKHFLKKGVKLVVVSLGEKGALLVSEDLILEAEAIPTRVKGTVGAGDSMVGAFAVGLMEGYSMEEMLKLAIAAATVSVKEGKLYHDVYEINRLKETVIINKIN